MVAWPSTLPAPLNAVSITLGDNTKRRKCESGRTEVRRFGSGMPDTCTAIFRLFSADIDTFINFYEKTSNMGLNWFSATWIATDLGYTTHYARIVGYPKRTASGKLYSDFSVNLHIKKIASCWPDTTWPVLTP
jgi:hypothetical protein